MTGNGRRLPPLILWALLVVGPAAWMGHLLASYGLVYLTCRPGGRWWLHLVTVVAVAAVAAALVAGWRRRERFFDLWNGEAGSGAGWSIAALVGGLLTAYFLVVTAMAGLASALVSPCL